MGYGLKTDREMQAYSRLFGDTRTVFNSVKEYVDHNTVIDQFLLEQFHFIYIYPLILVSIFFIRFITFFVFFLKKNITFYFKINQLINDYFF